MLKLEFVMCDNCQLINNFKLVDDIGTERATKINFILELQLYSERDFSRERYTWFAMCL